MLVLKLVKKRAAAVKKIKQFEIARARGSSETSR